MVSAVDIAMLAVFIPTFFFVSITPGMCMTLAMTLGMSIGVRRSLYMMWGELAGVGLVAFSSVIGVAAIMLNYPNVFTALKTLGGLYLVFIGAQMWLSKGKMAISDDPNAGSTSAMTLTMQGFFTAVSNPKSWAFNISLLPPFINPAQSLAPQLSVLISIILITEFACLLLYASGGRTLRHLLQKNGNVQLMNRIAGSLMVGVGVWLALG
ncbi:threonine transporter RhtB [Enterovibrio coralii]|uniref:Threonine transporter RhtB n=2 Tax=Enterovibrio coralii TaxID=294935 RepID=A0A135I376_9GAMM|nr:threonine transporter RhtB [Enterovibrio coralii]